MPPLPTRNEAGRSALATADHQRPEDDLHAVQELEWSLMMAVRDPENEVVIVAPIPNTDNHV